jgi:hypothetical protein
MYVYIQPPKAALKNLVFSMGLEALKAKGTYDKKL